MHCELLLDCHARIIMAEAWKKLKDKIRAKSTKKDNPKDHRRRPKGEELAVQRLSPELFWESPKNFQRIGPREFVPFYEAEEMTTGNIKSVCERYFIPKIGKKSPKNPKFRT